MSSATTQSSRVNTVSYGLVLKWTLKAKQLNDLGADKSNACQIKSDSYEFKTIKDFSFFLEIANAKKGRHYEINIKGSKMWSFELVYAFLVCKDGAFRFQNSKQPSYLNLLRPSLVEEDVTIHCKINACCVPPDSSEQEEDSQSILAHQSTENSESMPDTTLPSDYKNVMVIDFIRTGIIPDLTVDEAIKIIGETKKHKCEALKILCLQYLMNNIEAHNLRKLLRASKNLGLPLLRDKCMERIEDGYFNLEDKSPLPVYVD